jgi:hypothetical protein
VNARPENSVAAAREFYRQQLRESFRYSRLFSEPRGSVADAIVDTLEFETVLRECPAGSFDCARRIGEMAVVQLDKAPVLAIRREPEAARRQIGEWWRDLLNFERCCFLQGVTTSEGPPSNRPRRGPSAVCTNFSWAISEVAERIRTGRAIENALRRPATLLFARDRTGRVAVVEVGADIEKIFRATNGLRTVEQIAATAGLGPEETNQILGALAGIGAIVPAMSPEEMLRRISESNL